MVRPYVAAALPKVRSYIFSKQFAKGYKLAVNLCVRQERIKERFCREWKENSNCLNQKKERRNCEVNSPRKERTVKSQQESTATAGWIH